MIQGDSAELAEGTGLNKVKEAACLTGQGVNPPKSE